MDVQKPAPAPQPGDAAFDRLVYDIVATVPAGKVITYGQIAEQLGDVALSQEVGHSLSRTPPELGLPCHRVVNRTGALSPEHVFGGKVRQRALLEAEGVTFLSDGRIDMLRHQWQENEQLSLL